MLEKIDSVLTHWGRVTHICVSKLTIIGSDNSLSPDRRQAIIWTNAGLLLIGTLGTNFSEILIEILTFSFKKMRLKVSSAKRRPFCLGLNVLVACHILCHLYVCCFRVDMMIPGVETVGGFSMCSSPQLLQQSGVLDLAVKYSSHPPAHWVHTQVG